MTRWRPGAADRSRRARACTTMRRPPPRPPRRARSPESRPRPTRPTRRSSTRDPARTACPPSAGPAVHPAPCSAAVARASARWPPTGAMKMLLMASRVAETPASPVAVCPAG
eukprot:4488166-Prymnesium_polylepis.1